MKSDGQKGSWLALLAFFLLLSLVGCDSGDGLDAGILAPGSDNPGIENPGGTGPDAGNPGGGNPGIDNAGGGPPPLAIVSGRIFDSRGVPLAGATVVMNNGATEVVTNSQGYFTCGGLEPGSQILTVRMNGEVLCEVCVTCAEGVAYDLGDLYQGMPCNCDLPSACAGDLDCDGLGDADEAAGWSVVVVLGDGTMETRTVTSDPKEYDTDRDGLNDAEEFAARIDPRSKDTDGDLLSDYAEFQVYKSNPTMVDTDGDSFRCHGEKCISDPNLWDGYELFLLRTSPTLADTDGDGMDDYQESNGGGTNPRVADLPQLSLDLNGNPLLELQVDYQTGTSSKKQELSREEEEQIDTDNTSTKMSIENTVQLHTETEAGTGTWPPSFNAKLTTDTKFHHGYFHDTSSNWKNTSVQQSQNNSETWEQENVSFDDGKLSVAMKVANRSDLSFKVKDLRLIAYRLEGGGNFTLIGTMVPDDGEWPEAGHVLGPGGEFTLTANCEHIGAEMMRSLVRNPTAMMFDVGSYSLFQLDAWGVTETVNYAVLGQSVVERTGLIVIDYGDGNVSRNMVSTNVYRNPDGSGRGLTLKEALSGTLGLDYATVAALDEEGNPGKRVLYRIRNVQSYDLCNENSPEFDPGVDCDNLHPRGFWLVGGTGSDFDEGAEVDFDDIVLRRGERINLVFNRDTDGDGIFDREEYLLGSSKDLPDTDGDGLTDYQESKVGWIVAVSGRSPYGVYSDPRFSDLEGDFLSDRTESFLGTDPFLKDTDGDGQNDTTDPFPVSPPCLEGTKLSLAAWWDGSNHLEGSTYVAEDIWTGGSGAAPSEGVMNGGADLIIEVGSDQVFRLNPGPDQNDQFIEVANQEQDGLSPYREYTLSAEIYWEGVATGLPLATVLSKGDPAVATYALSITPEGKVKFSLYRSVHDKCWGWFFGWVDSFCSDSNYNVLEELVTTNAVVPLRKFVNVTATFGGESMRIYVDGILAGDKSTTRTWTSGNLKHYTTTNYLVGNTDPLRIGGDFRVSSPPTTPFRTLLDDVRVYGRALNAEEIGQVNSIGVCYP